MFPCYSSFVHKRETIKSIISPVIELQQELNYDSQRRWVNLDK